MLSHAARLRLRLVLFILALVFILRRLWIRLSRPRLTTAQLSAAKAAETTLALADDEVARRSRQQQQQQQEEEQKRPPYTRRVDAQLLGLRRLAAHAIALSSDGDQRAASDGQSCLDRSAAGQVAGLDHADQAAQLGAAVERRGPRLAPSPLLECRAAARPPRLPAMGRVRDDAHGSPRVSSALSLIHISEPTRPY